jgi:serine/threonine protein kinase
LHEEFETHDEVYLVTDLVKGGDLFDAITQSVKFNEKDAAGMVRDLADALFYMHSKNIVHRDLKPENLLVMRRKDGSINIKLADFGLAMEVNKPIYTVCGTPTYVAPEILAETGYGLEVDLWATGVIAYILLCGFPPVSLLKIIYLIDKFNSLVCLQSFVVLIGIKKNYFNIYKQVNLNI